MSIVASSAHESLGQLGRPVNLQERYENFIGDEIVPTTGEDRANLLPAPARRSARWRPPAPRASRRTSRCSGS